jgi:fermentation-respiration switch protein FrsA (DUF1100 family)
MKRALLPLLVLALVAGLSPSAEPTELEKAAQAFLSTLAKEDFKAATKDFDETMLKVLPADKLQTIWNGLTKQVGAFKKQGAVRSERKDGFEIVLVACEFEKFTLDARVVFNKDKQITGLRFLPHKSAVEYQAPDYVKRDTFKESEIQVGSGEWALPGTLTLPEGKGPFAAVVLVQGSGPQDRDEAIGPNMPFRDLAWGLASRGIASLRYDKRTLVHGGKMVASKQPITVKEEVIDDALSAVALLRKNAAIDAKRIFVLGHSLGAMMAPRIAQQDAEIAGLIIMASPTRPLEDVIVEQFTYIYSLEGPLSEEKKADLEKKKAQAARLKDPKLPVDTPAEQLPLGQSAAYWLSLRGDLPQEGAAKLKQPILVLQGGRDYQVSMEDFAGWQKALAGRKGVTLKSYANLNHLFMDGKGKAKPEEYENAGHVAREVVEDIAEWIKKQ